MEMEVASQALLRGGTKVTKLRENNLKVTKNIYYVILLDGNCGSDVPEYAEYTYCF